MHTQILGSFLFLKGLFTLKYFIVSSYQIVDSNKPPEVMEKIINGRIRKFYSEVCLLEQEHMVEEGNPKVSESLKEKDLFVKSFEMLTI